MTDKEILDSVYQMTRFPEIPILEIKNFIEKELKNQDTLDVKEIERQHDLVIGEDGTVVDSK